MNDGRILRAGLRRSRALRPVVFAVLTAQAGAGCAIDGVGAVAGRVIHADGAVVVRTYALGVEGRTRAEDAGLTLGYSARTYVFAASEAETPEPGWHVFSVPLPRQPTVALQAEVVGVEARTSSREVGVSLGYRETTVLTAVAADASMVREFRFAPGEPEQTYYRSCEWGEPCEDILGPLHSR